jgi:hypothetical protein
MSGPTGPGRIVVVSQTLAARKWTADTRGDDHGNTSYSMDWWQATSRRHPDSAISEANCYVEVFAGAAALFFMRPRVEVEVLNDVNDGLINLYRVVHASPGRVRSAI